MLVAATWVRPREGTARRPCAVTRSGSITWVASLGAAAAGRATASKIRTPSATRALEQSQGSRGTDDGAASWLACAGRARISATRSALAAHERVCGDPEAAASAGGPRPTCSSVALPQSMVSVDVGVLDRDGEPRRRRGRRDAHRAAVIAQRRSPRRTPRASTTMTAAAGARIRALARVDRPSSSRAPASRKRAPSGRSPDLPRRAARRSASSVPIVGHIDHLPQGLEVRGAASERTDRMGWQQEPCGDLGLGAVLVVPEHERGAVGGEGALPSVSSTTGVSASTLSVTSPGNLARSRPARRWCVLRGRSRPRCAGTP